MARRLKIRGAKIKETQADTRDEEHHHERSAAPARREVRAEEKKGGRRERAREADVTGRRQESVRAAEDERMRGKRTGET